MDKVESGDVAFLTKDIFIDGQLAFSDNEKVIVESVHPNEQRPDYKYVVVSKRLLKRFQLRDEDLRIASKEAIEEPAAIREPLNEMLKLSKKTYEERKKTIDTGKSFLILLPFIGALVIAAVLIIIVIVGYSQANNAAQGALSFQTWTDFNSWPVTCIVAAVLLAIPGLIGTVGILIYRAKKTPRTS